MSKISVISEWVSESASRTHDIQCFVAAPFFLDLSFFVGGGFPGGGFPGGGFPGMSGGGFPGGDMDYPEDDSDDEDEGLAFCTIFVFVLTFCCPFSFSEVPGLEKEDAGPPGLESDEGNKAADVSPPD